MSSYLLNPEIVSVRYIAKDVPSCVKFYTELLGFEIVMGPPGGFAMLSKGNLRLLLNEPGAGGAGKAMPDGVMPTPGGWNRLQLQTEDIASAIEELKGKNAQFRNQLVIGNGGKQILLQDPSGNLVELVEPKTKLTSQNKSHIMRSYIFYTVLLFALVTFLSLTLTGSFAQSVEQTKTEDGNYVTGITSARARSLIGVGLALTSVIIGWRMKKRLRNMSTWVFVALALGILAILLSVIHLANNTGDFGSGGGKAGAIVALILGTIGVLINALTLRSQKSAE